MIRQALSLLGRQAETIGSISVVLGGLWWLLGDKVDGHIDGLIDAKQEAGIVEDVAMRQKIGALEQNSAVLVTRLDHVDKQADRMERTLNDIARHLMGMRDSRR